MSQSETASWLICVQNSRIKVCRSLASWSYPASCRKPCTATLTYELSQALAHKRELISPGNCIYPTRPIPCLRGARMEADVHSRYRAAYELGSTQQASETRPMDSLAVLSNVAAAAQARSNILPVNTRDQDSTAYAHNNSYGYNSMAKALDSLEGQTMELDPASPSTGRQPSRYSVFRVYDVTCSDSNKV